MDCTAVGQLFNDDGDGEVDHDDDDGGDEVDRDDDGDDNGGGDDDDDDWDNDKSHRSDYFHVKCLTPSGM